MKVFCWMAYPTHKYSEVKEHAKQFFKYTGELGTFGFKKQCPLKKSDCKLQCQARTTNPERPHTTGSSRVTNLLSSFAVKCTKNKSRALNFHSTLCHWPHTLEWDWSDQLHVDLLPYNFLLSYLDWQRKLFALLYTKKIYFTYLFPFVKCKILGNENSRPTMVSTTLYVGLSLGRGICNCYKLVSIAIDIKAHFYQ